MINSQIEVKLNKCVEIGAQEPTRYQDWVARFCYAAAKMPPQTVEHILGLMEATADTHGAESEQ
tara:strand:+ start:422 stop:613 length:192 start_codon:yes stop_codon:yes gene_type:complete